MRIWKSHPLLRLVNGYLVDSPQPSIRSFAWNFDFILKITVVTVIFILMMATAFLGYVLFYLLSYVLPYGQMSLWGATVITNLMSAIPWVGQDIVEFTWGGFSVNNATLNRLFILDFILSFALSNLVEFIFILRIKLIELGIDLSIRNIVRIIKISLLFRLTVLLVFETLSFFGITITNMYNIICIILFIFMVMSFIFTKDKQKFIFNLSVILSFWSLLYLFFPFITNDLLVIFLFNYGLDNFDVFELNISNPLEDLCDLFCKSNWDSTHIGFGGFPDPGSSKSFGYFFLDDDDDPLCRNANRQMINYFSENYYTLTKKAENWLGCESFILKYNNIFEYNDIATKIKINVIDFSHHSRIYDGTIFGGYTEMLKWYHILSWEAPILEKAILFAENSLYDTQTIQSFKYELLCKSDYNYWFNRQVEYPSIFRLIQNGFRIPYTPSDYYLELYNDAAWVELHLSLFESYMQYNIPLSLKISNFSNLMEYAAHWHGLKHEVLYNWVKSLSIIKWESCNSNLIDYIHKVSGHKPLSSWDYNYSLSKLGLGLSHQFAYSWYPEDSFLKVGLGVSKKLPSDDSLLKVGLGVSEKLPLPKSGLGIAHNFSYTHINVKDFFSRFPK